MSTIRCIYRDAAPAFPATDQHPDAARSEHVVDGRTLFVDSLNGPPTLDEIAAVLAPPPEPTPTEKLARAGLTVDELKALLGLA